MYELIATAFAFALIIGYIVALFTMPLVILPATFLVLLLKGN